MENKTNKEYYVEQQLAKTLIELLNVTSLDEISIRSLCEKAGVGRASWYIVIDPSSWSFTIYISFLSTFNNRG
ncbi:hypothetical protein [Sharpea azabuensis]|uniref:hypothetical protein n=1 Tax=Sharpea azabuensis TaxID=322505 RepID=UPI0013DC39B0|nr:hypothetical protein [Sharpea azabuensis]